MATSIHDFQGASQVLSEIRKEPVRVVDAPSAGKPGELDAKDHFERTSPKTGKVERTELGAKVVTDVAFRMRVAQAADDLAMSGVEFSKCGQDDRVNKKYWTLGFGGRMQVRKFLDNGKLGSPSAALKDVFENGLRYSFECSTAMMLIFHKAILDTVGDAVFDKLFTEPSYLKIFRWELKDADYLQLETIDRSKSDLVPGSHYYYRNPDASEEHSAFAGENVIYLGNKNGKRMFYAHGVTGEAGAFVVSEEQLIASLSALRKRGAKQVPYRERFTYSLDAQKLADKVKALAA